MRTVGGTYYILFLRRRGKMGVDGSVPARTDLAGKLLTGIQLMAQICAISHIGLM